MRVTDAGLMQLYTRELGTNRQDLQRVLRQLADGKQVRRSSDDPAGAQSAFEARARLLQLEGYKRAGDLARLDLATIESALGEVFDRLSAARVKGMEGGSTASSEAAVIANEINQIATDVFGLANTARGGRYLFSGTATVTQPFPFGPYFGNDSETRVLIADGRLIASTFSGQHVFLDGGDIMTTLAALSTAVRAGDTAAIDTALGAISDQLDHIAEMRAEAGLRIRAIDDATARRDTETLRLQQTVAEIENISTERVALELSGLNSAYEALSATAARVLNQSLFNFLG